MDKPSSLYSKRKPKMKIKRSKRRRRTSNLFHGGISMSFIFPSGMSERRWILLAIGFIFMLMAYVSIHDLPSLGSKQYARYGDRPGLTLEQQAKLQESLQHYKEKILKKVQENSSSQNLQNAADLSSYS